jgi:hypothetical protein
MKLLLLLCTWTLMMITMPLPSKGDNQENLPNRRLGGRGATRKNKRGAVKGSVRCKKDLDCNFFSNYCGDCGDLCSCHAVAANKKPCGGNMCMGPVARCFVDPCMSKKVICKAAKCVVVDI